MTQLRHALRQLELRPWLSLTIIAMLALGIGCTTAMFSVFHRVLLQPLAVPAPNELVNLGVPGQNWGHSSMCGLAGKCEYTFSYPMFRDLEAQQTVFTGIAAHKQFAANLAYDHRASTGDGVLVSGSYFDVLGLTPALGRLIGKQDEPKIGEGAVVVLGYDYWRNYFGSDPRVLDRTLTVNGQVLTIIGVAPQGFAGTTIGGRPRVYVPITMRWLMEPTITNPETDRRAYWVYLFARLRPGVTIEGALAQLGGVYRTIINEVEAPQNTFIPTEAMQLFRARQVTIEPGARGQSSLPEQATTPMALLFGVTALVLLLVCANVANLLLARGSTRAGEMAIRASLGADRGHLMRQALLEACVLAVAGGLVSIPVALITLRGVHTLLPRAGESLDTPLSGLALLFAAVAALTTVLLFGLAPAIKASRANPGLAMKGQAQQAVGTLDARRFRGTLATAQIVLSTVLLVLAGLFAQSLANLARVDLGMNTTSIATFTISPRRNGYSPEQATRFYDRLEAELAAQPGVADVASSMVPLLSGSNWGAGGIRIEGRDPGPPGPESNASMNSVSQDFFRTLSIQLESGRYFTSSDTLDKPRVVIVNESFLRKFKLGDDALGKHIGLDETPDMEIVGIVGDTKYSQVREAVPAQFFTPRQQSAFLDQMSFYVRAAVPPETLLTLVPRVVASLDPELPVDKPTTMAQVIDENVFVERMVATLSAGFALLATVLSAVGLYGVLAYFVTRRTREIGLRLALGATSARLRGMVLKQVAIMAGIGVPVGLLLAVMVGRAAEVLLFGLKGYDPLVLGAAVVVLGLVVSLAGYLPARRASSIAPMEALRSE